ncbi:hypothetical protein EYW49_14400 [Siculibacillus lacustris]|uniref:Sulfur globule protein n=1 Tax=Siculibacillus lacustris TaxID=1549641 RepID=A0A4Q9VLZ7_9HYPH|nr:hypothetical protein [Siculibacillus lacustris]TBW36292.1 hypothetical protein EYW49_14400 [Siculibacillus lacustris]
MRKSMLSAAAAVLLAVVGTALLAAPASAQPYWRHHHHHYGWGGPMVGSGLWLYAPRPRCWTEVRTVRVHTRHGWVLRDRAVRYCR